MAERDEKGHFIKGTVPNPHGRPPKGETITDLVREYLNKEAPGTKDRLTYKDLFVKKVLEKAYKGDMQAIKLLWNYIDGMPLQKNENKNINYNKYLDLSDKELKQKKNEIIKTWLTHKK